MMVGLCNPTIKGPIRFELTRDIMDFIAIRSCPMPTIVTLLVAAGALLYFAFRRRPENDDPVQGDPSLGQQFHDERVREMQEQAASGPLGAIDPNESNVKAHARSHMD
ncbi:hypothetical protein NB700_001858 [Xanthomonas sacchari]|uniref:Uncharacterized protein n=1 Tax=Xanthomonas sacchari TaxID=56458 RepID=A0ABT3DUZ6_9XANT|nr:hypothetical protein [Xanthomonas sacchari]